MALSKAKIITITSVKGGTGKSTTTLNLAGILSNKKKKTIIIDLDLYSGVIATALNIENQKDIFNLVDDLMNNRFKHMEDYVTKYNDYIDVLAAPIDPRSVGKIKASYIELIINRLELKYEYILIDTNHIIDIVNLTTLDMSDEVLFVMTNDLMDIKNMKTMNAIFDDMGAKYKIILNEARLNNSSYSTYDITNIVGKEIDYILPKSFYNPKYEKLIYEGKIATLEKTNTKGYEVLNKIIEDIVE